jgi:hypothetical protein
VDGAGLRLVASASATAVAAPPDPGAYQARCIEDYQASQTARGFSALTIDNGTATLERFLAACGGPAWEVTCEDIDRVVGGLAAVGMATSTRRGYVSVFKGFFTFLLARKASEIEALFGERLVDPVDEFNAARHVGTDSPEVAPPPTPATDGRILRVPARADRHRAGVRRRRPRLRVVPHPVSRRVAHRGGGDARCCRPAFRPRTLRQDPRAIRQGRQGVRAASAVGCSTGWI